MRLDDGGRARHAPADDGELVRPHRRRWWRRRARGCTSILRAAASFSTTDRSSGSPTPAASATAWSSPPSEIEPYFAARLGIEPLSRRVHRRSIWPRWHAGRRAPLKSFLLNQTGVAGIGNIYADEALWRAELHPLSPAGSMRLEHCEALCEGIVDALEAGLANGGASIDDYRDARGEKGSMQDEFLVHTREGEECHRCGDEIRRIVVSGRSTYFCPNCQVRLRRAPPPPRPGDGEALMVDAPPPDGFEIGHWTDAEGVTGCTVVIAPPGSRAGVDVRGGGPGTRETDVIGPLAGTAEVTAVMLSGGSAYGLAAADGAMRWLEEKGRGYVTPAGLVPIVPAAVDLRPRRGRCRPRGPTPMPVTRRAMRPGREFPSAGASAPARGRGRQDPRARERDPGRRRLRGGATGVGATVAALAVVNAFGDVIGEDGRSLGGPAMPSGEPLDRGDDRGHGRASRLDQDRGAQHDARLRDDRRGARQGRVHAGGADGERGSGPRGRPRLLRRRR